ncbi:hypothetical protein QR680_001914 [Steinernema hermaphroditum]|uniref:Tetraspanin n=1 Tax=Steinernema hermaphroditum TaxID=289476 RepID=A0AA39H240_9BILA|nr:hypothetical protein QR680_001914 [Steinernema hermaphroditum]
MKFIRSEEGAHKFNRWLFFGSNAFFWTLGWWFLVIGMWIYSDRHEYAILARASFNPLSSAGICLGCGLTVIIIGFVGVLGAWFENKLLLVLYISFVGFLFFVELTTGTLGFILRGRVAENVKMDLLYNINSTYVSKNHADSYGVRLTWDHLQSTLKCCGSNNYTNWFKSVYWPKNNFVPDSCCDVSFFKNNESMANCGQNYEHRDMWYQRGCYEVFTDWLLRHGKIIVIFSYIFVIADALALITAVRVYLFIRCREKNNEVGYRYKKGNNCNDSITEEDI